MAPKPSDARRRELGAALRRWRESAGLNGLELARKTGWSQSQISRLESGNASVSEVAVTTYLAHCGVSAPDVAEALVIARETEDGYLVRRKVLRTLVLHETTASSITGTAPLLIPGLLQTEDYARAVVRLETQFTEAEIESRVALRMKRQELLIRGRGPSLTFFVYEAALRCQLGGDRVMNEQMLHLAFLANYKRLTLRVVPFSAGANAATMAHFWLLEFAGHGPLLYLENRFAAGLIVENLDDIARSRRFLQQLDGDALSERQSRELFAQLASEYDRPPIGAT